MSYLGELNTPKLDRLLVGAARVRLDLGIRSSFGPRLSTCGILLVPVGGLGGRMCLREHSGDGKVHCSQP